MEGGRAFARASAVAGGPGVTSWRDKTVRRARMERANGGHHQPAEARIMSENKINWEIVLGTGLIGESGRMHNVIHKC
jgi:hypothetical protein